jgi:predicted enzyme related to lactoylglutathione lyase
VASVDEAAEKAEQARGSVVVEPFDALPAGRMAVLADHEGAVFCVWEARERKGAELVNDAKAWSWSQLITRDPDGAKVFYAAVFDWEIDGHGRGTYDVSRSWLPRGQAEAAGMERRRHRHVAVRRQSRRFVIELERRFLGWGR